VSSSKGLVKSVRQRVLDKIRDEPSVDWLVKHGMRLGVGSHIAHPIYFDRLHPWLISIGDHVMLSVYVAIITHDPTLAHHTGQTRLGRVEIGDRVMVGASAVILPGTSIGEDSVIGAGAVVRGEIPAGSLVMGNPGKVSPVKAAVAWHQVSARSAPFWPREGWTISTGITEERQREQWDALANCSSGFVPATAGPGSPYELRGRSRNARAPGPTSSAKPAAEQPAGGESLPPSEQQS
jgi:acetyltransferase-like isoleucine patch superfamily enzyme